MAKNNHFVWADLSTMDLTIGQEFYKEVFDWNFYKADDQYHMAYSGNDEASGIFLMAEKFQKMKMPSFWMSYIKVQDLDFPLNQVNESGGKIELQEDMGDFGRIALVRDPLGAGFTLYEGDQLNARTIDRPNTMIWNELFVSSFDSVKTFYLAVLDWKFEKEGDRYLIKDFDNELVGSIQEVSNQIKGDKEYWAVYFGVKDIKKAKNQILRFQGHIGYEYKNELMAFDPYDAMFMVREV